MKFSHLLHQRDQLIRQARLANLAYAHAQLQRFVARCQRAGLTGPCVLREGDAADGLPWPTLTAAGVSPAVLQEHFLEEEIVELADIFAFLDGGTRLPELVFLPRDLVQSVLPALRRELAEAGVPPEDSVASPEWTGRG
jgi:hypothetical protein